MTPVLKHAVVMAFAMLAIASCGGGDGDVASSPTEPETAASEPPESSGEESSASAPDDGVEPDDSEPPATTSDDAPTPEPAAPPEPATRVVETDLGLFEVPTDPQRIVVTDNVRVLPTVLDLGVGVHGTWDARATGTPEGTLVTEEEWARLEIVGSGVAPNVELLAAAQPDLVLHTPIIDGDIDLISEIAPVVPITATLDWKRDALVVAEAIGRTAEMATLLDDYRVRAAALAERIDDELGDPTVAVLRIRPDSIRVHTNLHFSGELLADVGLRVPTDFEYEPAADRLDSTLLVNLGLEQLGLIADADYIFILPVGTFAQSQDDVDAAVADVEASALWQTLPAVQGERVEVVGGHWFVGSLRAANTALAEVERFFFG